MKGPFWGSKRTRVSLRFQDPPPYTREMGTICPLGVFFPCFIVVFASKLAILPLKHSVLGAWKGHIRARKGQTVNWGFRDHKTTWNAFKTKENVITPRLASLHGLASNWAKNCYKTGGKKRQKDKWYPFRADLPPPPFLSPWSASPRYQASCKGRCGSARLLPGQRWRCWHP